MLFIIAYFQGAQGFTHGIKPRIVLGNWAPFKEHTQYTTTHKHPQAKLYNIPLTHTHQKKAGCTRTPPNLKTTNREPPRNAPPYYHLPKKNTSFF